MPEQGTQGASDRPAWAKDAVFYQIFPDRFARSERVPKPANLLPWHDEAVWDHETLDFFRQAIALRHAHPVLRRGHFEELYAHGRQYAFLRHDNDERLLVVLNAGNEAAQISVPVGQYISDGESLKPLFGALAAGTVQYGHSALSIPPRTGGAFSCCVVDRIAP